MWGIIPRFPQTFLNMILSPAQLLDLTTGMMACILVIKATQTRGNVPTVYCFLISKTSRVVSGAPAGLGSCQPKAGQPDEGTMAALLWGCSSEAPCTDTSRSAGWIPVSGSLHHRSCHHCNQKWDMPTLVMDGLSRASWHEDVTPPGTARALVRHGEALAPSAESDCPPPSSCPFLKASRQTGLGDVRSEMTRKHADRVATVPSQRLSSKVNCKTNPNDVVFQSGALGGLVKSCWCYRNCGFCFRCFQNGGTVSAGKRNKALKSPFEPSSFQLHVSESQLRSTFSVNWCVSVKVNKTLPSQFEKWERWGHIGALLGLLSTTLHRRNDVNRKEQLENTEFTWRDHREQHKQTGGLAEVTKTQVLLSQY